MTMGEILYFIAPHSIVGTEFKKNSISRLEKSYHPRDMTNTVYPLLPFFDYHPKDMTNTVYPLLPFFDIYLPPCLLCLCTISVTMDSYSSSEPQHKPSCTAVSLINWFGFFYPSQNYLVALVSLV
uniref:Uncharacterized protein n=1 Tax=Arundo donax TaxID=35708 RepID=A0A0A9AYR4_ARUDO